MKIEKVNDRQIRCTLTGADLADRQLKLSELAYGSEKAKRLFRDMMQQASFEFGFEAEDIPLMIEAIPVNADCIVLIITKVDDPDEIDTRFSKFAPSVSEDEDHSFADASTLASDIADDVMDLFQKLKNSRQTMEKSLSEEKKAPAASTPKKEEASNDKGAFPRILVSSNLGQLCAFCRIVHEFYHEDSVLYKITAQKAYGLYLTMGQLSLEEFGRICNIATEYGKLDKVAPPHKAFIDEHYETVLDHDAVAALAQI